MENQKCGICSKPVKNLKLHKRMAHLLPPNEANENNPNSNESLGDISVQRTVTRSLQEIAEIIYIDVVRPLCEENGISVGEWSVVPKDGYLRVAKKILG